VFTDEPTAQQETPLASEPATFPEPQWSAPPPPLTTHEPDPAGPWLKLLLAIGTWFMSILLLLFVPVIVALPYIAYLWRTRGIPKPEVLATDKTLLFISIVGIVPAHLLTLLIVWLVATEWRRRPFWQSVKFEWPKSIGPMTGVGFSILVALLLFALGALVTKYFGANKTDLDMLVESSLPARFATAFVAVVTAPLVEELIYRGVLYSAIERALGRAVGIGVVGLLFAGVHAYQYRNSISVILVITMLSFTLTFVRAFSGKLLPSFVIHLVFNAIQSVIIVLAPFFGWGS
jgi:membrane protease YdiL (CAAX protease family)